MRTACVKMSVLIYLLESNYILADLNAEFTVGRLKLRYPETWPFLCLKALLYSEAALTAVLLIM